MEVVKLAAFQISFILVIGTVPANLHVIFNVSPKIPTTLAMHFPPALCDWLVLHYFLSVTAEVLCKFSPILGQRPCNL